MPVIECIKNITHVRNFFTLHKGGYWLGWIFIAGAGFIVLGTFAPILHEQLRYQQKSFERNVSGEMNQEKNSSSLGEVVDTEFGMVIPKIDVNVPVVADVDWTDSQVYQQALTRGVAHAKGSSHPGEDGNIFLFAHSGADFFEALRFNAVFSLMNKLEVGDELTLWYHGQVYRYRVTEKKIVSGDALEYLIEPKEGKVLTLMTCWPPGTTLKRLLVSAEQQDLISEE